MQQISILVYHLIQGKQGLPDRWETIKYWLSTRIRVTMQAKTKDQKTIYHRSTTKAKRLLQDIYRALGKTSQILKAKRTEG